MKKLEAIVRSERMPEIKEKLRQAGIEGMTISRFRMEQKEGTAPPMERTACGI
ncbi:MAG: P-II family nitrogen regulator [Nitrososphaera sp.]